MKEALDSPGAELIAVYGRRRTGKTFLIKEFFNNKFDFYATGVYQGKQKDQIKAFTASFSKQPPQEIKDWMDAFVYLRDYLNGIRKKQLVVFLDELPWFDVPPGHFLKAFEWFWNSWGSTRPGLKMIVCGSATTWMRSQSSSCSGPPWRFGYWAVRRAHTSFSARWPRCIRPYG